MNATKTAKRILSVKVERIDDYHGDISELGHYSGKPGADDVTIDRVARGDCRQNEYPYFIAAMSAEDTGNPQSVEQDYQRAEAFNRGEWSYMGVRAVAVVEVLGVRQTVTSGSVWGLESDSDDGDFAEVGAGELDSLHDILAELGFTGKDIDAAMSGVNRAGA